MDKDKIINYVMSTPENSNYSVLKSLLDSEDDTGSDVKFIKLTLTNNRAGVVHFYACKIKNGKMYAPYLTTVKAGETKEMDIGYSTTGLVFYFMDVVHGSSKPVFSAGFVNVSDTYITAGSYDIYRMSMGYAVTGDELTCTVT